MNYKSIVAWLLGVGVLVTGGLWLTSLLLASQPPGSALPFSIIEKGQYSKIQYTPQSSVLLSRTADPTVAYVIVSDDATWKTVWSANHQNQFQNDDDLPTIDFSKNIVIAIVLTSS